MSSETYWLLFTQRQAFATEIETLKSDESLSKSSCLFSLHPFLDSSGRVGGSGGNAQMPYSLGDTSGKTSHHITSYILRTSSTYARRTNASYSVSQSPILHHWWPEDYSFDYAWLYHLSTMYSQTKTATSGPGSSRTHYARLSVRSSWSRLCRTVCLEIWINSQTLVHQSIRLPLRVANHQSCSPRISVRSFYRCIHRCLATVHFSQRQALLDMK